MKFKNLIIVIIGLATLFACQSQKEKRAEKFTEKIMERASGEDIDVDVEGESITIKTDEGKIITNTGDKSWPSEISGKIPEFKYGKLENSSLRDLTEVKMWTMLFEGVPADVLDLYQVLLRAKDFETNLIGEKGIGGMLTGEKDAINIAVMAGEGNASITVSIEK